MEQGIILARVSSPKQEAEGLSLKEIQLPALQEYARQKGIDVPKNFEFVFQETADNKIRHKFNEVLDLVRKRKEIKHVICFRVDRITRNYRDAVAIDDLRTQQEKTIHFVHDRLIIDKNSSGRDIQDWDLKVFLAKQYINRLKDDAVNSANTKLRRHEWPSYAPYGYKNIDIDRKQKTVVPEPPKSLVVQKIFEWYASGNFSMLEIRAKIKKEFNLDVYKSKIECILKRKFYHGVMVFRGVEYPHDYERLITEELYDRAQDVRNGHNKKKFKYAGLPYAYRGLIHCSECGCLLTPEKKKGKYVYYHCTQFKGKHKCHWLTEETITGQFEELFKSLRLPENAKEQIVDTLRSSHAAKSTFNKQLNDQYNEDYERYENRIEKIYDEYLDGRITEDYHEKKREEYRTKQREIVNSRARLHIADEEYYLTAEYLLELSSNAYELFKSSEPIEKRQILNLILQNLELTGKTIKFTLLEPFNTIFAFADSPSWLRGRDSNPRPRH